MPGVPLTDAEAMDKIWKDIVRLPGRPDRGLPVARETAMLKLAELELTAGDPFRIGPEFAHDELRRYTLARLLLGDGESAARLLNADAPRWTLSAARLAC